jgi:uncharacterized membrane-anchored protein
MKEGNTMGTSRLARVAVMLLASTWAFVASAAEREGREEEQPVTVSGSVQAAYAGAPGHE